MKYILLLFFTAGLFWNTSFGQQPAQYSLYFMNKLNWNPAYAGLDHSLSITAGFRKQWVGLTGSPTTQNVNMHMPLYMVGGGIGLNLENDEIGAERIATATLSYNYQTIVGSGILSFGLAGGLVQRTLNGDELRTATGNYDPNDPGIIDHNDDLLPIGTENGMVSTFHAGVYFQNEKVEGGISVRNLTEPTASVGNLNLELSRNYFFLLALHLDINRTLTFHPSVFARSDFIETQIDFSAIVKYNDNIFGGASLRGYSSNSLDAVAIILGFNLSQNITLAYAYDLTLSDLNTVSNGSHEIMVNYNLNKRIGAGRPPRIIYNPRSL